MLDKVKALNFSTGEQVRVNVRCNVDGAKVRHEKRDGRDVIIVPSYTLPDNVVMNGILYPAEEIAKSYKTLEGTPAPLGHPTVNSMFVSAKSPLGLNIGYFGAWNANVSQVDGRVFVEKIIDVERANESKMGQRVLAALEAGEPIHTSTGLLMNIRECTSSDLADWEGYNMEFDHDAILLDEAGAATPEQGVGMLVNDSKLQVINSTVEEREDERIDYLGMELVRAMRSKEDASAWGRMKEAIMEALGLGRAETSDTSKEAEMDEDTKKALEALNTSVGELAATVGTMAEQIGAIGETVKSHNSLFEAMNADREAEKAALVNQAVEAKLLSEDDAKATPVAALKALVAANSKEKPVPAPGIAGGFQHNNGDNVAQFSPLFAADKKEA